MIVSVITPSYNQGKFIEETIQSVLSQEGHFSLEHIIVDGGSTDNSVEIIKKYDALLREGKYPIRCNGIEYRWVSEPDRGQSNAVNKGIRMARGEIIGWLNSDDTYCDGALARVAEAFNGMLSVEIVHGDCNFIDEQSNFIARLPNVNPFRLRAQQSGYTPMQPATFFRKRIIDKIGYLDESLDTCMDYEFFIRAVKKGLVTKYIHYPLANFRMQKSSKTEIASNEMYLDKLTIALKHFGLDSIALLFGNCCCDLSCKRRKPLEEASLELKALLLRASGIATLPAGFIRRALIQAHLKNGIYRASEEKKTALAEWFYLLIHSPLALFSRDGLFLSLKLALPSRFLPVVKNLQFLLLRKAGI